MNNRNLLLLSASRVGSTEYLSHALPLIKEKLTGCSNVIFVPFAGVTLSYDEYTTKVNNALSSIDVRVKGLHEFEDKQDALTQADAVIVGGGNTFHLLAKLYEFSLIKVIKEQVDLGKLRYIGWSAGSNIAGLSIKTTNDMPIVEPESFDAIGLVKCQLNPHYTEYKPAGFNGETREQRLSEFMVLNPESHIIGLVEGSGISVEGDTVNYVQGNDVNEPLFLFNNQNKTAVTSFPADLSI
ncbi:dipeptidase PepE [Thalassotalea marina]|uniref:Peptidase E n=1 Tax=Thalassotalea marina TaxID=1673741 RepID=A0A919BHK0_9GAMM|nr:dipeptidase PepE [Thalassotalea marina]GHF91811.1 peptidase E [Thalassotalea marina]